MPNEKEPGMNDKNIKTDKSLITLADLFGYEVEPFKQIILAIIQQKLNEISRGHNSAACKTFLSKEHKKYG